jgi:hypothetical protein
MIIGINNTILDNNIVNIDIILLHPTYNINSLLLTNNLLLSMYQYTSIYEIWLLTINSLIPFDMYGMGIIDTIRYEAIIDYWPDDEFEIEDPIWERLKVKYKNYPKIWEGLRWYNPFEWGEWLEDSDFYVFVILGIFDNFKLGMLLTKVETSTTLLQYFIDTAVMEHSASHQDAVRLLYFYQPIFDYFSNESLKYYPLYNHQQWDTTYFPNPQYWDNTWATRNTSYACSSELYLQWDELVETPELGLDIGPYIRFYTNYYKPWFLNNYSNDAIIDSSKNIIPILNEEYESQKYMKNSIENLINLQYIGTENKGLLFINWYAYEFFKLFLTPIINFMGKWTLIIWTFILHILWVMLRLKDICLFFETYFYLIPLPIEFITWEW